MRVKEKRSSKEDGKIRERRLYQREMVGARGMVYADGLKKACVIRDISPGGIGLQVAGVGRLPAQFRLVAESVDMDVEKIWHHSGRSGVTWRRRSGYSRGNFG